MAKKKSRPQSTEPALQHVPATEGRTNEVTAMEVSAHEVQFTFDDRHYRIRGLEKNLSTARMHVNLKADRLEAMHVDTLDLYNDRQRLQLVRRVSEELYVDERLVKRDVARILAKLEALQRKDPKVVEEPAVTISPSDERAALVWLKEPRLLDRLAEDLESCGLVGERTAGLVAYLACTSRKLAAPLAVLVQSSSGAGKTTLLDTVLGLMPPEDTYRYSAMTGQSLYYMGASDLKHKILAISEEEGVTQASYALKLLQSEGRLQLATTEKDSETGRQQTQHYTVEGPVAMLLTTTAEHPDHELQNRCVTLHVNESAAQTAAIHARQRAAYSLAPLPDSQAIRSVHHNAQRLLAPLPVVIPWSEELTFRSDQTRMRREQPKYLQLIAALALLHQYQRERVTRVRGGQDEVCVVASRDDVEVAGQLLSEVAGTELDGLLPQTRLLLNELHGLVTRRAKSERIPREGVRFTQREVREALGLSDRQLRRHLARLVELEYVVCHRTGSGNSRDYTLIYDGQGKTGQRFMLGLVDAQNLPPLAKKSAARGQTGHQPAALRRASGGEAAPQLMAASEAASTT